MASRLELDEGALRFVVEWGEAEPRGTAAEATRGRLLAAIEDSVVWGEGEGGFSWTWIELLEFLSASWKYLQHEDGDPLGLAVAPQYLRAQAAQRWADLPESMRERDEEDLWAFERTHNLAEALQGAWLAELWVVRRGRECIVATREKESRDDLGRVLGTLERLGDAIAARVGGLPDERGAAALAAWSRRDVIDTMDFVTISTGLQTEAVEAIQRNDRPEKFWGFGESREDTEILAAARMMGPELSPEEIRAVAGRIRMVRRRETPALDALTTRAPSPDATSKPHEQGYELAIWLRSELGAGDGAIDVERLLKDWKVTLLESELAAPHLDAVCCWGPSHGPAILLNPRGRHAAHTYGRRATLAHEICHLLVDRAASLPLAEVLGGRAPYDVEARARAFAAELLLPRRVAGEEVLGGNGEPEKVVARLRRRFRVSREVVCWQIRNSGVKLSRALETHVAAATAPSGSIVP